MRRHSLISLTVFLGCATLLGCEEGARGAERGAARAGGIGTQPTAGAGVIPGIHPSVVFGEVRNPYAGDHAAIATGRQLFVGFNCAGCHAPYAGGGMGPNLRDTLWQFGNSDAQIFSSIVEGRAGGMPAWGGKITDDQVWMIIAYLRTLGTGAEPVKPPAASIHMRHES